MPDVTVVVKSDLATAAKMHFFSKEAKVFKENVETNGNWLKKILDIKALHQFHFV